MSKYLVALYAFLLPGCDIDRVPDYGSRDLHRTGFDGCLSGVSSSDGSLYVILVLVAVLFYMLGKSRSSGGK